MTDTIFTCAVFVAVVALLVWAIGGEKGRNRFRMRLCEHGVVDTAWCNKCAAARAERRQGKR